MFDVKRYEESKESLFRLKKETDSIKEEIRKMINHKNKEIGKIICDYFLNYYNKTKRYQMYGVSGSYREGNDIIEYRIEIGDELVDQLKIQYGKLINRNYKRSIELNIVYDIIKDDFNLNFYFIGFYDGLIRDETIQKSICEMLLICKDEFEGQNLKIEEIEEKLSKVKYHLDNYEAFVIANKLIQY